MSAANPKHITVLGANFIDYVSFVDRFPLGGETIHAESFQKGFGGKGANQAVMAGRLGGKVRMVGSVGADGDGADYIKNFKREGVETTYVQQYEGQTTGLAKILVDKSGENLIVICPNATGKMTPESLSPATWLEGTDLFLCQNEVPLATNLWALEKAHQAGKQTIFAPAPAPSPAQLDLIRPAMKYVSIFMPNQHEASVMLGYPVEGVEGGVKACLDLRAKLMREDSAVIITLGGKGSLVLAPGADQPVHVPAVELAREKVIDTTGAGDCFTGSLIFFLSIGNPLLEAVKKATYCAAQSVQKKGTQLSYPHKDEIPREFFDAAHKL